jgi:hypothetical protein
VSHAESRFSSAWHRDWTRIGRSRIARLGPGCEGPDCAVPGMPGLDSLRAAAASVLSVTMVPPYRSHSLFETSDPFEVRTSYERVLRPDVG